MNFLQEIKILAPRVIKNADKIVEGVSTNIQNKLHLLEDKKEKEIERRRTICKDCPFNSENAKQRNGEYEQLIKHIETRNGVLLGESIDLSYKTNRVDLHCTLCGCNIENKTSCLSCTCGVQSFNEANKTNLEVRWTSYNE